MKILRPDEIQLLALGRPIVPANGGGGDSSSSSSSSQTTNQIDRRQVVDSGSVGVSSDTSTVSVQILDGGAIAGAKSLADNALALVKASDQETGKTLADVLGFAENVFTSGLSVLDKAGAQVKANTDLVTKAYDNAQGEGTQKNLIAAAALATVAIVAVKVWGKQ